MAEILSESGSWDMQMWLAASVMLIVIVAIIFLLYRLYGLIRNAGKSAYKPNLRRLRSTRFHAAQDKNSSDE